MLYQKSPILAASTALPSGLSIILDKYFRKAGKFWEKERNAEKTSEQMAQRLSEELSAHMEVVLAGEKERFFKEIKEFMAKEQVAITHKEFFDAFQAVFSVLCLTLQRGRRRSLPGSRQLVALL